MEFQSPNARQMLERFTTIIENADQEMAKDHSKLPILKAMNQTVEMFLEHLE